MVHAAHLVTTEVPPGYDVDDEGFAYSAVSYPVEIVSYDQEWCLKGAKGIQEEVEDGTSMILDTGCTKAMCSRHAYLLMRQGLSEDRVELLPDSSTFNFANGQKALAREKCRIWFSYEPPLFTDFSIIIDEGKVPFLMSLPQMKNLGVSLDLRGTPEKHDPPQPIAAEPAIPPPAAEKKYRLLAGQKVPPAQLHQRTAERNKPEVKGPEEQGAEPAALPPPVHQVPAEGAPEPPLPPEGDEGEALPQRELNLDGLIPPPLVKLHQRLSKRTELLKLHLKHYHMSSAQFRRRTSEVYLPEGIYRLYESVVKECETCQKTKPAPPRSRFSGVRARELAMWCSWTTVRSNTWR